VVGIVLVVFWAYSRAVPPDPEEERLTVAVTEEAAALSSVTEEITGAELPAVTVPVTLAP